MLKDDNLGLGAKRGSERPENFGLAGLESILGRLNGKEEDVKREEERRTKIEQRAYVYRKYGFMNFVSGGFLVGDKIERSVKNEVDIKVEVKSEPESSESESKPKSKKRKRSAEFEDIKEDAAEEQPKLKRKKKSMNLRDEAAKGVETDDAIERPKKDKRSKKTTSDPPTISATECTTPNLSEPITDKARRKAEKRARKEEKKLKKALKKAAKEAARSNPMPAASGSESDDESTPVSLSAVSSVPTTGTSTPLSSVSGLTFGAGGRHAVRQRYIRQKKMASMDPQALKEVRRTHTCKWTGT